MEAKKQTTSNNKPTNGRPPRSGGPRKGGRPAFDRPKPEFDQKMVSIRRVTRVVAGGRRMSFAVSMVIGDKKGSVGVGTGKASDTSLAIAKAQKAAKKNLLVLKMTKTLSIPFDIKSKFSSSKVMLMPNRGRGIIAGSAVRDILILAGLHDVTAKILSGSKNKLNIARATIEALKVIGKPRSVSVEIKKEEPVIAK